MLSTPILQQSYTSWGLEKYWKVMNIVKIKGGRYAHFVLICTIPIKWLLLRGQIVGRRGVL
jgi:hypothetical protein